MSEPTDNQEIEAAELAVRGMTPGGSPPRHSPTPWKQDGTAITGPDGSIVSDVDAPVCPFNAAHIVACVNCHDELLAACQAAVHYAETCRDMPEFSSGYCIGSDHLEAMKAAIAKAEGRRS